MMPMTGWMVAGTLVVDLGDSFAPARKVEDFGQD